MNATADLLRLLSVPVFAWVAWRDVKTRRIPDRVWVPLLALAVVTLALDALRLGSPGRQALLAHAAVSVGLLVPLSYAFWYLGGFGGADAKAFLVIATLFPTYPSYEVFSTILPRIGTTLGVFSITVVTNTVLLGVAYPFALAVRNAVEGRVSPRTFVARPIDPRQVPARYGRLLTGTSGFGGGLDLDALRMYLRWRGTTLSQVRADPTTYRDPASLPTEPSPPGDGSISTGSLANGGVPASARASRPTGSTSEFGIDPTRSSTDDPWGATAFLEDIEGTAYGTTPADLRAGLDALAAEETVWVTPGIPFLVPLFCGLCVGLVYGDLLFAGLDALGVL